jgi:hypothetical protein
MSKEQEEIQAHIEALMRLASRYKVVVCGFAFAAEPAMIVNFGNCNDAGELKLYEKLTSMCNEKRLAGQAKKITVGEVN